MDEDALRAFLPSNFGKKQASTAVKPAARRASPSVSAGGPFTSGIVDGRVIGPPKPALHVLNGADSMKDARDISSGTKRGAEDAEDSEAVLEAEEVAESVARLPLSHEVEFSGHTKAVTALALDPTGSRMATGACDYSVKLWHFAGMDDRRDFFRSFEPWEGHKVTSLEWSLSGDRLLVATANPVARIYDREGTEVQTFTKGDQYLVDMTHTKGHVGALCNAVWHPSDHDRVLTGSLDSTVRVWNARRSEKQLEIIKLRHVATGRRVAVTYCTYTHAGNAALVAAADGSLQLWSMRSPYNRPQLIVKAAHVRDSETSCVAVDRADRVVVSRGGDDTLKAWDLRKFSKPVASFEQIPSFYGQTDTCFSPDEEFVVTGTSARNNRGEFGKLLFFHVASWKPAHSVDLAQTSLIRIKWHSMVNQLLVGCGDSKVRGLYSPQYSSKGVLPCVTRHAKRVDSLVMVPDHGKIVNPHALPMYREQFQNKRRKLERIREDPVASHKPENELAGTGHGGKLGSSYSRHLIARYMPMKTSRDVDPREAFLRHAKEGEENPVFADYRKTVPKGGVFMDEPEDDSDEDGAEGASDLYLSRRH